MIWDQTRKSSRPEFEGWKEITENGEDDLRMEYSRLVHYEACKFSKEVGHFASYFNRISKMGRTIASTGRKVSVRNFNNPLLYDLRWDCKYFSATCQISQLTYYVVAIKQSLIAEANIHMIQFYVVELHSKQLFEVIFSKLDFSMDCTNNTASSMVELDIIEEVFLCNYSHYCC